MSDATSLVSDVTKDAMAAAPLGPIGMALGGAAGLISHYAPSLMAAIFGSDPAKAPAAAAAASAAVAQITGSTDPKQQLAAAQADPNVALELQVQLANMAVALEEQKAQEARDAASAQLAAQSEADRAGQAASDAGLSDTADARRMAEAYVATGKTDTRANIMVIGAAVGLVACVLGGIALSIIIKQDSQANGLIIGLLVSVAGVFGNALLQAYGFEFGNSRQGSNQSDQLSAVTSQLMAHTANSVPISALSQMGGGGGGSPQP